jgi:hypothetical protein
MKKIRVYGQDTTPKSRDIMYNEVLNEIVYEKPYLCNNPYFFNEIKTLGRTKKGTIAAREGFHDDAVMSYLIGLYMLWYGKNTNKFVKITSTGRETEEDKKLELDTERTKNSVTKSLNIINSNKKASTINARNVERFILQYEKMTVDNTDYGRIKNTSKNQKIVNSMNFIHEMNNMSQVKKRKRAIY